MDSEEGYLSKCHLCMGIRKCLSSKGDFTELQPKEFYQHLEQKKHELLFLVIGSFLQVEPTGRYDVLTAINKSVIARDVFNSYPSKHNKCRSWVFLSISMKHCPILVGH